MKRPRLNLSLTGVMVVLLACVLVPVVLSTAVGIVTLAIGKGTSEIVSGVLVISFATAATGGVIAATVLVGRKHRIARRQADFLANISHELRTPLSSVRMYTQTLQSGKLADDPVETAKCLETILRETAWLDSMIDKVLTWRASSKDAMPLNMHIDTIGSAVNSAVDRFRAMVPPDEIELVVKNESCLPVSHDVKALSSVVLNLLTNAYKYTRANKNIRVVTRDEHNTVVVQVVDNGVGLSPLDAVRVFEPFYRADSRLSGKSAGIGLGLAIARHLVRKHNGQIRVASEPGKGSTFTVRLPAVAEGTVS